MSDDLLLCAASNWCVSSVLAAVAWFVQVKLRRPVLAHLLWLLVLVKLVTPPLFSLAVLPPPAAALVPMVSEPTTDLASGAAAVAAPIAANAIETTSILFSAWLLGSVIVLLWSSARIVRFHRLLTLASRPAPRDLRDRAAKLARQLGIRKLPSIQVTSARVSPMVWWLGGQVRIFIPADMPAELGAGKTRWILAHELAHVRRGDHYVRWLEWLACVAFWWNPVAWLARRNLRANEEVCCDALVLRSFAGKPHSYANSLLSAVEFLASPGLRPPAMASEINSGGFLERRFRMIVSKTPIATTPRWLQAVLLVCTVAVMPLGLAYAQNPDVDAVSKRLKKAVQAGELSGAQARTMLGVLKKQAAQDPKEAKPSRSKREQEHYKRLVQSLQEGLREGVRSGKIDEAEAEQLYRRQMARLEDTARQSADRRAAAAAKERRTQDKKQTPKAYYEELERSLKDGLRAGLESGRFDEEEAARLYELNIARITKAAAEAKARRAQQDARRANDLEKRDRDRQNADRKQTRLDYSVARGDFEAANKDRMEGDLDKARRALEREVAKLRRRQVELEKRQADIRVEAEKRAMQLRAMERSLKEKQRAFDRTEREFDKQRASHPKPKSKEIRWDTRLDRPKSKVKKAEVKKSRTTSRRRTGIR